MSGFTDFIAVSLAILAPLAPAAVGGLATEFVGTLNIALEGLMLAGAFTYAAVGTALGPMAGAAAAMAVCAALAWAGDLFSRRTGADAFVVGLGMNMLVPAAVSVLSGLAFGTKGVVVSSGIVSARVGQSLAGLPVVGALFGHRLSDYLALLLAAAVVVALKATPFGLRARTAGMNPEVLRMAGLDYGKVRGAAYAVSGLACGAAGAALAADVGAWVPNMSAGRGWIALVAIYLGGRSLGGTLAASAVFALLLGAASQAQALPGVEQGLLLAAPYFLATAMVFLGAGRKRRM